MEAGELIEVLEVVLVGFGAKEVESAHFEVAGHHVMYIQTVRYKPI